MSNKNIALAYCEDNANIAQKLVQYLASTDYQIEEFKGEDFHQDGANQHQLIASKNPILLVVSDNFLKSEACMNGALKMLQQLSKRGRVMPIITDGRIWDEKSQGFTYKETSFEKVSNVIQYMNFWQERYLEVRRKKRHLKKEEEGIFNVKLKRVRSISSEVGEFLRHLRGLNFVPFDQLEKRQLEPFFKFMGDHKGLAAYKAALAETKEKVVKETVVAETAASSLHETPYITEEKAIEEAIQQTQEQVNPLELNKLEETRTNTEPSSNTANQQNGQSHDEDWQKIEKMAEDAATPAEEEKTETANEDMILLEEIMNGTPQAKTPSSSPKEENLSAEASLEALENIFSDHPTPAPQTSEDYDTDTIIVEEKEVEIPAIKKEETKIEKEEEKSEGFIESLLNWDTPSPKQEKDTNTEEPEIVNSEVVPEEKSENIILSQENDAIIEKLPTEENSILVKENPELTEERQKFLKEEPIVEEAVIIIEKKEEENTEPVATEEVKEPVEDISSIVDKAVSTPHLTTSVLDNIEQIQAEKENAKTVQVEEQNIEQTMAKQTQEVKKTPNIDDLFQQGKTAEEAEDYELAKKYYEKVANINDHYPDIHVILGRLALYHFTDAKEASKHFKKAIKINPNNAEVHYQYANLLYEYAEKPYKAARHFKNTIKLQPDHPFAHYDLALIYYQLGDKFRANRAYLKAIEINPELQTEQNDLAFGYAPQVKVQQEEDTEAASKFQALQKDIQRLEQLLIANQTQTAQKQVVAKPTKTVFITGATSGIGRATAEIFAQNGYRLIITGRRKERLKVIKGFFTKNYQADILTLPFDVRDLEAVKEAIDGLADDWRQIDVLINNAGLAKGISPIHEGDISNWDTMIDTNIKGLLYMTRAITPHMVKRKSGHIINVGSTSGKEVYPGGNVYCATKFAVDALTKAMRIDLHQHNVRVSQVSPAHVEETEFSLVRFDGDNQRANKVYEDFRPLTPKDVAEAIYFMATRPPHVNVLDVVLQGTQQASANHLDRSGR